MLFSECGDTYCGQFKYNLINGFRVYKWASGQIYKGAFQGGLSHGHGYSLGEYGRTYEGLGKKTRRSGMVYSGILMEVHTRLTELPMNEMEKICDINRMAKPIRVDIRTKKDMVTVQSSLKTKVSLRVN